jgi:DNA-binding response OmpR family regulator
MSKETILVIDDERDFCQVLSLRLKTGGWKVLIAHDGEQGLRYAKEESPDLIILDLNLPRLSGEEVCKAIKEEGNEKLARIPIIMLTAKDSDVDRQRFRCRPGFG